jgi:hypothetical protein
MRVKLLIPILALCILGVAACGSSGSSSTSSSLTLRTSRAVHRATAGPIRIYRLKLTGTAETPRGAPNGAGDAVIAFHGSSVVCWRFAHLHGFTRATLAHIHVGARGISGPVAVPLSTAPRLHHQGCTRVSAVLVRSIEQGPHSYYVNIHSARYPGGAVRAQL